MDGTDDGSRRVPEHPGRIGGMTLPWGVAFVSPGGRAVLAGRDGSVREFRDAESLDADCRRMSLNAATVRQGRWHLSLSLALVLLPTLLVPIVLPEGFGPAHVLAYLCLLLPLAAYQRYTGMSSLHAAEHLAWNRRVLPLLDTARLVRRFRFWVPRLSATWLAADCGDLRKGMSWLLVLLSWAAAGRASLPLGLLAAALGTALANVGRDTPLWGVLGAIPGLAAQAILLARPAAGDAALARRALDGLVGSPECPPALGCYSPECPQAGQSSPS